MDIKVGILFSTIRVCLYKWRGQRIDHRGRGKREKEGETHVQIERDKTHIEQIVERRADIKGKRDNEREKER